MGLMPFRSVMQKVVSFVCLGSLSILVPIACSKSESQDQESEVKGSQVSYEAGEGAYKECCPLYPRDPTGFIQCLDRHNVYSKLISNRAGDFVGVPLTYQFLCEDRVWTRWPRYSPPNPLTPDKLPVQQAGGTYPRVYNPAQCGADQVRHSDGKCYRRHSRPQPARSAPQSRCTNAQAAKQTCSGLGPQIIHPSQPHH